MAQTKKRSAKRQRQRQCLVRMTDAEYRISQANAANTGLTMPAMARELMTGYTPTSVIDDKAIIEMIRLRADLGRIGGLLKWWLGDDKNMSLRSRQEINQWRDELLANQKALRGVIDGIKRELGDTLW